MASKGNEQETLYRVQQKRNLGPPPGSELIQRKLQLSDIYAEWVTVERSNCWLLVRDAFVRTNRHAIVMMFVRPSVCLSVWDGRALWSYGAS